MTTAINGALYLIQREIASRLGLPEYTDVQFVICHTRRSTEVRIPGPDTTRLDFGNEQTEDIVSEGVTLEQALVDAVSTYWRDASRKVLPQTRPASEKCLLQ